MTSTAMNSDTAMDTIRIADNDGNSGTVGVGEGEVGVGEGEVEANVEDGIVDATVAAEVGNEGILMGLIRG